MRVLLPILALALFSTTGAVHAADTSTSDETNLKEKHISIPFFFVTDRDILPSKHKGHEVEIGVHRQYLGHCPHEPNMGTATCVIDNIRGVELDGPRKALNWVELPKAKEGQFTVSLLPEKNFEERENNFYNQIAEAAKKTPDREVALFVPGYMSTFRSGAESAARIAYYSNHPVLLYSWPSRGSVKGYVGDESSIEWSQPHFNRMIKKLTATANANQFKIRMYSHSMGNRLGLRAAPHLRENHAFSEVAMICPDLDEGIALHYLSDYASPQGTTKGRLYVSRKDRALIASQFLHGGYLRFGQDTGFSTFLPDDVGNPHAALANHRFQSIDYTSIDQGGLGHKIPVALMCNMSAGKAAPAGLKLLETSKVEQTRAAKVLEKVSHLAPEKVSEPHYVVQIDKADKKNAKFYRPHKIVFQTMFRKDWSLK